MVLISHNHNLKKKFLQVVLYMNMQTVRHLRKRGNTLNSINTNSKFIGISMIVNAVEKGNFLKSWKEYCHTTQRLILYFIVITNSLYWFLTDL